MMLKTTGVQLELMTDLDQILFVEQNIRGGLSYIGQRFCKKTPDNDLLYIDGKHMCKVQKALCFEFSFLVVNSVFSY